MNVINYILTHIKWVIVGGGSGDWLIIIIFDVIIG